MSAVSGIAKNTESKASKEKKFSTLNINNLYKGTPLEATKTTAQPKHGLQTLGKVSNRRNLAPANVSTLNTDQQAPNTTAATTNNNQTPSTTSSSTDLSNAAAQPGWSASSTTAESTAATAAAATLNSPISTIPPHSDQRPNAATAGPGRPTWNSTSDSDGPAGSSNFSSPHQATPYFPQEFPQLSAAAAGVAANANSQPSQPPGRGQDYGPGPSLRPQTSGNWTRGTGAGGEGPPRPNAGNGAGEAGQRPASNRQQNASGQRPAASFDSRQAKQGDNSAPAPPAVPVATIVPSKALQSFDAILTAEAPKVWFSSTPSINYSEKINFSDDEEEAAAAAERPKDLKHQQVTGNTEPEQPPRTDRSSSERDTRSGRGTTTSSNASGSNEQNNTLNPSDAVARARERREREERVYEESKRAAQDKAFKLAQKQQQQTERGNSQPAHKPKGEPQPDKPIHVLARRTDQQPPSARNEPSTNKSRPASNLPPRFQKIQQEKMQHQNHRDQNRDQDRRTDGQKAGEKDLHRDQRKTDIRSRERGQSLKENSPQNIPIQSETEATVNAWLSSSEGHNWADIMEDDQIGSNVIEPPSRQLQEMRISSSATQPTKSDSLPAKVLGRPSNDARHSGHKRIEETEPHPRDPRRDRERRDTHHSDTKSDRQSQSNQDSKKLKNTNKKRSEESLISTESKKEAHRADHGSRGFDGKNDRRDQSSKQQQDKDAKKDDRGKRRNQRNQQDKDTKEQSSRAAPVQKQSHPEPQQQKQANQAVRGPTVTGYGPPPMKPAFEKTKPAKWDDTAKPARDEKSWRSLAKGDTVLFKADSKASDSSGLSKSSPLDQQDSGVDLSDQPASRASSQRSSPNAPDKPVTTNAKLPASSVPANPTKVTGPRMASELLAAVKDTEALDEADLQAALRSGTAIFKNRKLTAENELLDGKKTKDSEHIRQSADLTIRSHNVDAHAKDVSTATKHHQQEQKLEHFNKNGEPNASLAVGAQIAKHPAMAQPESSTVTSSSEQQSIDLQMKMASIKKVWDSPSEAKQVAAPEEPAATVMSSLAINSFMEPMSTKSPPRPAPLLAPGAGGPVKTSATISNYSVDPNALAKMQQHKQIHQQTASIGSVYAAQVGSAQQTSSIMSSSPPVVMSNQISSPPLDSMRQPAINAFPMNTAHSMATQPMYGQQQGLYQHFSTQAMDPMHLSQTIFAAQTNAYGQAPGYMQPATNPATTGLYNHHLSGQQAPAQPQAQMGADPYRFNQMMKTYTQNLMQQSNYYSQTNTQASNAAFYAQPAQQQTAYGYPGLVGAPAQAQNAAYRSMPQQMGLGVARPADNSVNMQQTQYQRPVMAGQYHQAASMMPNAASVSSTATDYNKYMQMQQQPQQQNLASMNQVQRKIVGSGKAYTPGVGHVMPQQYGAGGDVAMANYNSKPHQQQQSAQPHLPQSYAEQKAQQANALLFTKSHFNMIQNKRPGGSDTGVVAKGADQIKEQ